MDNYNELYKINDASYQNTTLTDGHWKNQFDETMEFYLAIENDSLLYNFREAAGFDTPGRKLTGWYGRGNTSSTFGQKLAAFAKMYKSTGDTRLKEKALYLTNEWIICVDQNHDLLNMGHYTFDKMIGGFLEIYEQLGYVAILEYIEKLTDRAIENFPTDINRDGLHDKELCEKGMAEWYTLPENIYRIYQITGKDKHKKFALEWDYEFLWEKFTEHNTHFGGRHAYSQINSLSSAAQAFITTNDEKYLDVIKTAYDQIIDEHIYITGGYGPAENIFVDKKGYLGESILPVFFRLKDSIYRYWSGKETTRDDRWGNCEVPCCSWAVFKLCNYLIKFTGDAKYGNWVEKLLYNGTGAQLPVEKDGRVHYYSNYFVDGAYKTTEDRRLMGKALFGWQCCSGTYPQDIAEYNNMLYYTDADSIYVSQYLPSKFKYKKDNIDVEIENFSNYPQSEQLKFSIKTDNEIEFSFKFRVPNWVKGKTKVKVNGIDCDVECIANKWGEISRLWSDGDIISIEFPFDLYFTPVDTEHPNLVALSYGPIVLVADKMSYLRGDINNPEEWITKIIDSDMEFVLEPNHVDEYDFTTRTLRPFYKVGEMEWYYMYNEIHPEKEDN